MSLLLKLSDAVVRLRVALFMATLLAPLPAMSFSVSDKEERPEVLLKSVTDSYNRGEWNECLNRLHEFIRDNDSDATLKEAENITYAYLMLGNVHMGFASYISAENYYTKAYDVARRWDLRDYQLKLSANLAAVNCYLNNRRRAEEYLEQLSAIKDVDPGLKRVNELLVSAFIERTFGDWRKSIETLKAAIAEIDRNHVSPKSKVTPYSEITEIFEEHGMPDSALRYLKTYEAAAREHNMSNMIVDVQRLYMRIYTRMGDANMALYYQDRYTGMQDSLLNRKLFLGRAGRFERERQDRTEQRIEDMELRITLQHLIMIVIGVGLAVSVGFVIVILRQKRRLRSSYRRLYDMNRELLRRHNGQGANLFTESTDSTSPEPDDDVTDVSVTDADPGAQQELADKILRIMDSTDAWCAPDFSLTRLASLAGSNTRYVSQAINDRFGKNFRTFINEYRVSEAMRRMGDVERYGRLTIQAIGESVGFMSRSNFIAAFKRQTGLTPSVYQKISLEDATGAPAAGVPKH